MNNDIKEIIQQIKTAINFKKQPIPMDYNISIYDMEQLLNYITNLQEENKQLKEQLKYLRKNQYLNQVKWERNINEYLVKELELRIDKAIEYIEENKNKTIAPYGDNEDYDYEVCLFEDDIKELLDILRGEDNE